MNALRADYGGRPEIRTVLWSMGSCPDGQAGGGHESGGEGGPLDGVLDGLEKRSIVHRLHEERGGSLRDHLLLDARLFVAGDHHGREMDAVALETSEDVEPGQARQMQVEHQTVGPARRKALLH